jgi:class 3 adenylate cyclase
MVEKENRQELGDSSPAYPFTETLFLDRVLMFTDIEGSSSRWDSEPDTMRLLMRHHDSLVATVVERHGGVLAARTGDGAIALFVSSTEAVQAALEFRAVLPEGPRVCAVDDAAPLSIRIGLHRGVVEPRDGEYYGPPMHRAARIMSTGHGGQIVVSEVIANELARALSEGITLADRGVHRLKGFHEPERLTEILLANSEPDPRGLRITATAGSLPLIDLEAFVGRDDQLNHLLGSLTSGRVITLLGPGGVGKTRFALQLATLAQREFADGAWFVDLASVSSPERVVRLLAETLEIADENEETLVRLLRHALQNRQILLVLDNCEHVWDAVRSLLSRVCSPAMSTVVVGHFATSIGHSGGTSRAPCSPVVCIPVQRAPAVCAVVTSIRKTCNRGAYIRIPYIQNWGWNV